MSPRSVRAVFYSRGFTLIEFMTVVAIIGVVAAMAIPNVNQRIQVEREAAALAEVRGALTSFRNLARTKVVCVQVAVVGNTLTAAPYIQCNPLANPLPVETFKFEEGFDKKVKILAFSGPGLIGNPVF
jgi:prepilin-type N-terminal cleavage/methylation domain-containing protein